MATIETIGIGGDYATPQEWYDAHKGNITSDANAPYIGEIMPGTYTGGLAMDDSTTDITHYFHLRATTGGSFDGNFLGSYPMILKGALACIYISDAYTRIEHVCVGNSSGIAYGIFATAANGLLVNACGAFNMTADTLDGGIHVEGLTAGQTVTIANCAVGALTATAGNAYGIVAKSPGGDGTVEIYNNTVHLVTSATGNVDGIQATALNTIKIINNAIGTLTAVGTRASISESGCGTSNIQYNAGVVGTGLSGPSSIVGINVFDTFVGITALNMNLHLKDGQPGNVGRPGVNALREQGLNLRKSLYSNAPVLDIDGNVRPKDGLPWNIGADSDADPVVKVAGTGMRCLKTNGTYTYAQWRLFYPNCPKVNAMCNPLGGAYVSASTVCSQGLW